MPANRGIRLLNAPPGLLMVESLALQLPDGRPLLSEVSFTLKSSATVLLTGPSGSGKSTLLRAMAGLWPFGSGTVHRPPDERSLFLPQKPYLPVGTLREVVGYPCRPGEIGDDVLHEVLCAVDLSRLAGRLDQTAHWMQQLSTGEQQRIAFARVLAQRPDWLFLDEATSALAETEESEPYRLLRRWLRAATVLSVGHRSSLRPFHARHWTVVAVPGSAARLVVGHEEPVGVSRRATALPGRVRVTWG